MTAFVVIQLGLFLAVAQQTWLAVAGIAAGVIAVALTFARWHGRWVTDTVVLRVLYRLRRGTVSTNNEDARLAALCTLVPDLVVEDVEGPESAPAGTMGMGSDGAGWFTVIEIETGDTEVEPPVPLSAIARIAAESEQPGVVVQVVSYAVPVAGGAGVLPEDDSGRRLGDGEAVARQHILWVAIRLDATVVAESAVDHPDGEVDVPATLAEITRRVGRALRRRGLPGRVLDADGVLDALTLSCDLTPGDRPVEAWENWDCWQSAHLEHRCFWLKGWPHPDRAVGLLAALGDVPDARVSVTLLLEPTGEADGTAVRCLVRVAAQAGRSQVAGDNAVRFAERFGGELFALDGEQAQAVYCTVPSGGGAR